MKISQIELDTAIERAEKAERDVKLYIQRNDVLRAELREANDIIDELRPLSASITHRYDTFGLGIVSIQADNLNVAAGLEAYAEQQGWRLI